jgi:hypothetical protein
MAEWQVLSYAPILQPSQTHIASQQASYAFEQNILQSIVSLGRGPVGEIVLTMRVGDSGKFSSLLTADFAAELAKSLARR